MPDKRKRGRKGTLSAEERLQRDVLRRYKAITRTDTLNHLRRSRAVSGQPTVHMRLAQEFGIPCQRVLDIIDPDRVQQRARIVRHDHKLWRTRRVAEIKIENECFAAAAAITPLVYVRYPMPYVDYILRGILHDD